MQFVRKLQRIEDNSVKRLPTIYNGNSLSNSVHVHWFVINDNTLRLQLHAVSQCEFILVELLWKP